MCSTHCFVDISDNVDLGTACGKYYRVCCLSIIDPGLFLLNCHDLLLLGTVTEQPPVMSAPGDSDIISTTPGTQWVKKSQELRLSLVEMRCRAQTSAASPMPISFLSFSYVILLPCVHLPYYDTDNTFVWLLCKAYPSCLMRSLYLFLWHMLMWIRSDQSVRWWAAWWCCVSGCVAC